MFADEGKQFDWRSIPAGVYVAIAVVVGVLLVIVLVFGLVAYRRAKRSGRWRRAKLTLQAEVFGPGPQQELAKLRLRLDQSLAAATGSVTASRDVGVASRLDSVNDQLQRAGQRIARQLDVLAATAKGGALDRLLTPLQRRVDDVERLGSQIVDAAAAAMAGDADVELDELTRTVAEEIETVNLRLDALRELSHPSTEP